MLKKSAKKKRASKRPARKAAGESDPDAQADPDQELVDTERNGQIRAPGQERVRDKKIEGLMDQVNDAQTERMDALKRETELREELGEVMKKKKIDYYRYGDLEAEIRKDTVEKVLVHKAKPRKDAEE